MRLVLFCSFVQLLGREVNPDSLGSEEQESVGSRLALNRNFNASKIRGETIGSPFAFFFRHYATSSKGFFNSIKRNEFLKFLVCKKKRLINPKGLFLGFLAICDFFYQILFLESFSD